MLLVGCAVSKHIWHETVVPKYSIQLSVCFTFSFSNSKHCSLETSMLTDSLERICLFKKLGTNLWAILHLILMRF